MSTPSLTDLESRAPTSEGKAERLTLAWRRGFTPPPRISVSDWADRYRVLPQQEGGGKWSTAKAEIARGPMLAVTEPGVHIITAMACTQILKTSLLINTFGYFAHLDPCAMLLVQPKDDAAQQFSKERITPNIAATPVLKSLIGTRKTRSADESIGFKAFPGGFLAIVGAGSPTNLASRPVRVTLFDEIDKYEVTREGDPITLGEERTAKFGLNWLSIRACSPTVEDESRIASSYAESDQRRASVACPDCGHRQFLDFFRHVDWDKAENGEHKTSTARIYCEGCGAGWTEGQRLRALQTIRWHQTRPFTCCGQRLDPLKAYEAAWNEQYEGAPTEAKNAAAVADVWDWWAGDRWAVYRAKCPCCGGWPVENEHAGFQASKLYSPWQKDKPSDIAKKWISAKGDEEKKQAWWNTQMGMPYRRAAGKQIAEDALLARREVYPADVPDGVALLTFGGDTQDDRVEIEVVGWGRDEESWSIAYEVFEGDPEQPDFWERIDEYLKRKWLRADGRPFVVEAGCIDSGGHHTQAVYEFCKARAGRNIFAIKGDSERSGMRSPVWPPIRKARRSKGDGFKPVILGTNAAKDRINERLKIERPGPGYMHYPAFWDAARFGQLTAERLVPKKASGRTYRIWEPKAGRSNEALDCRVYAYAALCGLLHRGLKLNRRADEVGARSGGEIVLAGTPKAEEVEAARTATPVVEQLIASRPKVKPRRPRGNFLQGL